MERIQQIQKALKHLGFVQVRHSGSHEIWRDPLTGLFTTIVIHGKNGKKLDKGAIANILRQVKNIELVRKQKGLVNV